MIFDFQYMLWVMLPTIVLAMAAQAMVKSAYGKASKIAASSGLSGAEAAAEILRVNGIQNVGIEPIKGYLGDHYDPKKKMLRLSPDVYHGRSLASLGIAAHEVGHAIQDARNYAPLVVRNGLVPMAMIGPNVAIITIIVGYFLLSSPTIAMFGLALFGVIVLFQLVNLPVEFNASRRAKEILVAEGMITTQENRMVGKVLNAAAMTYVAATIGTLLTFLYYAMLIFGRRD
jgi:hypothetical protein